MRSNSVSIIILPRSDSYHLKILLKTFFRNNTHAHVELIVIDHDSTGNTSNIIADYATQGMIRLIPKLDRYNFAASSNFAAQKATQPFLLFLNNDIVYTSDMIPKALQLLENETIGVVGCRLDDVPVSDSDTSAQTMQRTGITFEWDDKKQFHRPVQVRHDILDAAPHVKDGVYPAVNGAFMLCRTVDFQKIGGFCEAYDRGFEDIDFCLRVGRDLKKKCFCINSMSLQHLEGTTRKQSDFDGRAKRSKNNDFLFKKRMGRYVADTLDVKQRNQAVQSKAALYPVYVAPKKATQSSQDEKASSGAASMNILYVLYNAINSNGGIHVQLHAERLMAQYPQCDCRFAVPDGCTSTDDSHDAKSMGHRVLTFSQVQSNGSCFGNGRGPDMIHAWTPREGVRKCCENLLAQYPIPLIIHLEDNEEYLTEVTVGRPYAELVKLPINELDTLMSGNPLVPGSRYHPIRGKDFLGKAWGITMIIDTLDHFNYANLPSMVLPPPVDERLFYPRPLNMRLREELKIPKDHIVLTYTGNVHAANKDEVRELYKAVHLLNEQGHPTVLLRTGKNAVKLGDEKWLAAHEKHLGWVTRSKVPEVLAAADVLVQPGEPGPFNDQRVPSKLPEYFAMGRPVVLPKTNLGLRVVNERDAYVLDKADAEEIAKAVLKIKRNKNKKDPFGKRIFTFYNKICSYKSNGSKITSLNVDSFVEAVKPGVSLVTCCKNRNKQLLQSIKSWLSHTEINEVIIVDWNSDIPIADTLDEHNISDIRVLVVRVENEPYWILSHAYNLGFRLTQYDKVLKVDSDILIHDNFFIINRLEEHMFIAGNCATQPKENSHINGFFFVYRESLFAVNGFNENLSFYGWDDDDLYLRLQSFGIERRDITPKTITHLKHEDKFRLENVKLPATKKSAAHLENDPDFLIRVNRELSYLLPPWWRNYSMSGFRLKPWGLRYLTAERAGEKRQIISNMFIDYAWDYAARELLFERERIDSTKINYDDFWNCMAKSTWSDGVHAILECKKKQVILSNTEFTHNKNIVAPLLSAKGKTGISLVTCTMNRSENLLKAIGTWVTHQEISEIIIVDWSSDIPISDTLQREKIGDKRIRVIRVEGEPRWILSYAYNLGFRISSYDTILKTDADIQIKKDFFSSNQLGKDEYIAGNWRSVPPDQVHVNGFFFIKREHLSQVNGFNELITTYGWDDDDLYSRLNGSGLKRKDVVHQSIYHIPHGSHQRIGKNVHVGKSKSALEHALMEPLFFIQTNRIICEKMKLWGSVSEFAQFHEIKTQEEVPVVRRAPALRTRIPRAAKCAAEAEALKIVAQNLWGLDFWKKTDAQVRRLLYKKEVFPSKPTPESHESQNTKNPITPEVMIYRKKFFVDVQHGLGNRLRAIGSAAAIAEKTDRELVIVWEPDHHCECRLSDLFDYSGAVIEKAFVLDAARQGCNVYNYMEHEDGATKDKPIDLSYSGDIYARSNCVLKAPPSTWEAENRFLRSLPPTEAVHSLVASVHAPNDISAHVRMEGGADYEHLAYEAPDNWTKEAHMQIDFWRRKSHFKHFMARIDTLISEGRAEHIFLAADKPDIYDAFLSTFGKRIIYLKRDVYDRSAQQLQYALADAILLGTAPLLLGSTWSSFSELAMRLSSQKMQIEMSGKDF